MITIALSSLVAGTIGFFLGVTWLDRRLAKLIRELPPVIK